MFDFSADIRRLIYTTNAIEGYHRQVRKVIKNKLLYLATHDIVKKWTIPIFNWTPILTQLAIYFEDRLP